MNFHRFSQTSLVNHRLTTIPRTRNKSTVITYHSSLYRLGYWYSGQKHVYCALKGMHLSKLNNISRAFLALSQKYWNRQKKKNGNSLWRRFLWNSYFSFETKTVMKFFKSPFTISQCSN